MRDVLSIDPLVRERDGRRARRERGRLAVIAAVLELFDEGHAHPSAGEVAQRSGVSAASVFRYFENLDELHRLAFETQLERVVPMLSIDGLATMTLDRRVEAFVQGRLDVYELIDGPARMIRARAVDHPAVAQTLARARRLWLGQVRKVFTAELAELSRSDRRDRAALVDAVASFESWDLLHRSHGLPRRSIATVWASTIEQAVN